MPLYNPLTSIWKLQASAPRSMPRRVSIYTISRIYGAARSDALTPSLGTRNRHTPIRRRCSPHTLSWPWQRDDGRTI